MDNFIKDSASIVPLPDGRHLLIASRYFKDRPMPQVPEAVLIPEH